MTMQNVINLGVRILANTKYIVAALFFCVVMVPSTRAQIVIDVSKFTCKDFLDPTITRPDYVSYWLNGYYNGKRSNTVLDVKGLRDYVSKLEDYCLSNQDAMVMKAAETFLGVSK
jgi:acid stress chaperone HdeB